MRSSTRSTPGLRRYGLGSALLVLFLSFLPAGDAAAFRLIRQTGGVGTYTFGKSVEPGSGATLHWTTRQIGFRVNDQGAGDGLTFEETLKAVATAYTGWQEVGCTDLRFIDAGVGTTATLSASDGLNTAFWAEDGSPLFALGTLADGVAALTFITIQTNQEIVDVDVAFNGRDYDWKSGSPTSIEGIAAHEIGHMLGFHHTRVTADPIPTMTGSAATLSVQLDTLESDDEHAVCHLYPAFSDGAAPTGFVAGDVDGGGLGLAAGDFNGDGRLDLATGSPDAQARSTPGAGVVHVIYGGWSRLDAAASRVWHQGGGGLSGAAETGDRFGAALTAGDFNRDGYADLAIGVPGESIGAEVEAGAVHVLYGSPTGLTEEGDQVWHQDTSDVNGTAEVGDRFGASLASGDFDADGYADLAIGVPGESVGGETEAGAVNLMYGSAAGLTAAGNQLWHQDTAGVEDEAEPGDQLGSSLAVGDFDGDSHDDLAAGAPGESVGDVAGAGAVNVLYGSVTGLTAVGDQVWHQNSGGIHDSAEGNDRFGSSVAAGDFDADGYADLAVGVVREGIGMIAGAGAVHVMDGSADGLTSAGGQLLHQDTDGILGIAESDDGFGADVEVGDFDGDGFTDLAVGVPSEGLGLIGRAGAVVVILGSADGLDPRTGQLIHQDAAGVHGTAEAGDRFGASLAAGDFSSSGQDGLAVGVPGEEMTGAVAAGAVNVLDGSEAGLSVVGDQMWHQGAMGMARAEDGDGPSD